jgi:hypothetical protein
MRSQVQVLAGPPPIPAGHSAAGSEPGAPAASLGRAGAARPSPPARHRPFRTRPPGAAGPHDHHPPWSLPSPGRQPRGRCGNLALQPAPVPPPGHKRRRYARRPGLPGRSAGQARPPAVTPPGPGPGPPPTPLTNATSAASPTSGPVGRPSSRSKTRQPTGARPVPVVTVAFRLDLVPPPPPEVDEMDASGRTEADSSRLDAGRTGHRTHRTPDGRTPDALDTRRPDTGRLDRRTRTTEPLSGHHMVDADRRPTPWLASWPCRPRRQRPTAGCRLDAPPGSRRLGDQPTRTARQQGLPGRARPPPRPSAAGATPPSSWRLGALLSSDDFGSRVGRRGACHPVYGDACGAAFRC